MVKLACIPVPCWSVGGLWSGVQHEMVKSLMSGIYYFVAQSQGHHTVNHLGKGGVERRNAWWSFINGWERDVVGWTNTGTVSKTTLENLPRDGVECTYGLFWMHRYHLELNWKINEQLRKFPDWGQECLGAGWSASGNLYHKRNKDSSVCRFMVTKSLAAVSKGPLYNGFLSFEMFCLTGCWQFVSHLALVTVLEMFWQVIGQSVVRVLIWQSLLYTEVMWSLEIGKTEVLFFIQA